MKKISDLSRLLPAACFALVVAVGGAALMPKAVAQEAASGTSDGFTDDPGEPIEVVSDTAEWKRAESVAIFTGRVDAVQGTMRLRADKVFVHYVQKEKAEGEAKAEPVKEDVPEGFEGDPEPGPAPGQSITKIDAKGNVIITDIDGQTAVGDWALYDMKKREIYMGDTVVLTQGENVIRGQKLVMNLDTGQTVVDAGTAGAEGSQGGRVRSVFVPAEEGEGG
ncbi:LptA/OstA family protein [Pyruvatibacter sp.]|uniref:LptA/OstA family protein n=1 Tax=Pyruvatibacter sp. TaxID=1981328 RepID=UPI003266910F